MKLGFFCFVAVGISTLAFADHDNSKVAQPEHPVQAASPAGNAKSYVAHDGAEWGPVVLNGNGTILKMTYAQAKTCCEGPWQGGFPDSCTFGVKGTHLPTRSELETLGSELGNAGPLGYDPSPVPNLSAGSFWVAKSNETQTILFQGKGGNFTPANDLSSKNAVMCVRNVSADKFLASKPTKPVHPSKKYLSMVVDVHSFSDIPGDNTADFDCSWETTAEKAEQTAGAGGWRILGTTDGCIAAVVSKKQVYGYSAFMGGSTIVDSADQVFTGVGNTIGEAQDRAYSACAASGASCPASIVACGNGYESDNSGSTSIASFMCRKSHDDDSGDN